MAAEPTLPIIFEAVPTQDNVVAEIECVIVRVTVPANVRIDARVADRVIDRVEPAPKAGSVAPCTLERVMARPLKAVVIAIIVALVAFLVVRRDVAANIRMAAKIADRETLRVDAPANVGIDAAVLLRVIARVVRVENRAVAADMLRLTTCPEVSPANVTVFAEETLPATLLHTPLITSIAADIDLAIEWGTVAANVGMDALVPLRTIARVLTVEKATVAAFLTGLILRFQVAVMTIKTAV